MLGGSAGVLLLQPNGLHGGASGAVFGLLGAAAVIMYRRGINPLSTGVGTLIVLNLLITFTIGGISIGGHLGGLVAGAAAGSLMASSPPHAGSRSGSPTSLRSPCRPSPSSCCGGGAA